MSTDGDIKRMFQGLGFPGFGRSAFQPAPDLASARVAIVTTAGLGLADDPEFGGVGDQSFRVLPAGDRRLKLSHMSPNWDRTGLAADLNVGEFKG
jgi:hypothetical protein